MTFQIWCKIKLLAFNYGVNFVVIVGIYVTSGLYLPKKPI